MGNVIVNANQAFTFRDGAKHNTVVGNTIYGSATNDAYFGTGNENVISGNVIHSTSSKYDSILVWSGARNTFEGNFIKRDEAGSSAIRWNGKDAIGGDVVTGNLLSSDKEHKTPAMHIDTKAAKDITFTGNAANGFKDVLQR
jgi:hypothetical protein